MLDEVCKPGYQLLHNQQVGVACCVHCFFHSYHHSAPSGSPQSVSVSSQAFSSITIQWGRVSCIDRNSVVTGYRVQYRIDGSTASVTRNVPGVNNRRFTASGLEPCTSYRFEVAAVNSVGSVGEYRSTIAATRNSKSVPDITADYHGFPATQLLLQC